MYNKEPAERETSERRCLSENHPRRHPRQSGRIDSVLAAGFDVIARLNGRRVEKSNARARA